MGKGSDSSPRLLSVIIPARDAEDVIADLVRMVLEQSLTGVAVEVVVVNDGSTDRTAERARHAGARVVTADDDASREGNPAAARNRGAAASRGDSLVFLDADCTPRPGWLKALLHGQSTGAQVVGGSLGLPEGLSLTARCDYYCGWYHVHPGRPAGPVGNHPPGNLSVRREAFLSTGGFHEQHPVAYAHEELRWQSELQQKGGRILFVPEAVVDHHNRPGLGNLLRRNYRWGYSALEAKSGIEGVRYAWLYRHPWLLVLAGLPLSFAAGIYIVAGWLRSGRLEPAVLFPVVLAARVAYAAGMTIGGIRWLRSRGDNAEDRRPRWE